MSRTIRRGKASRNIRKYMDLHVIVGENRVYGYYPAYNWFDVKLAWKDGADDTRTYDEYCRDEIRFYHSEMYWITSTKGLPRYVRCLDRNKQKRRHKQAIHNAVRSGDYDVVLEAMRHDAEWMWY